MADPHIVEGRSRKIVELAVLLVSIQLTLHYQSNSVFSLDVL